MPTRSQVMAADVSALLRARNACIQVKTGEEARAESYLVNAAVAAGYKPTVWDCAAGACDPVTGNAERMSGVESPTDPGQVLDHIRQRATRPFDPDMPEDIDRRVWIMRDLHKWLEGPIGIQTSRQLRNLARTLSTTVRQRAQAIIVLTPSVDLPTELQGHMTVIDWPLPDRDEVAKILDDAIAGLPAEMQASAAPNGERDKAIDAAVGLSGDEASSCYAKSIVQTRRIDPAQVSTEKKRIIAKDGLLQWMDPLPGGFASVGGLEGIKQWFTEHKVAFTPRAKAYGLPNLKGIFFAGVSGGGKTYMGKALAWELGQCPLIRVDMGALQNKYVGESQKNLRKVFGTIESCGTCVVLFDEIEKMMAGSTQGAADGGVAADAMGALLTWMQERTSPAFCVATANDITGFADKNPEFLRRGRWDELFFVDLPTRAERIAILQAALRTHKRELEPTTDWNGLALLMDGFSGAEIASLVPDAMFRAFADGERQPTADDISIVASRVVPLSRTAKERLDAMRTWAKTRARSAGVVELGPTLDKAPATRQLDVA